MDEFFTLTEVRIKVILKKDFFMEKAFIKALLELFRKGDLEKAFYKELQSNFLLKGFLIMENSEVGKKMEEEFWF